MRDTQLEHGVFPLWSYAYADRGDPAQTNVAASVLLRLYDYKRETTPPDGSASSTNDYARARVLWHLWHYERLNGDVSVDLFPGITYDCRNDGFKRYAWLWRFWSCIPDAGERRNFMFAGYNSGPGNIQAARRKAGGASTWSAVARFLDAITGKHAAETITYVQRICLLYSQGY